MSRAVSADGTSFDLGLPRNATIRALRYLRNGKLLAVASKMYRPQDERDDDPDVVQIWEVGQPTPLCEWKAAGPGTRLAAIHPEGSTLATSAKGELALWALPSGQQLWSVSPHSKANGMAFSPDGQLLATVGPYGLRDHLAVVELRDALSGTEVFSISPGIASCDSVAFSPDGTKLAVEGIHEDPSIGSIFVWATDGRKLVEREHELGGQSDIVFSPNGEFMVTTGTDIRIWEAGTGDHMRVIKAKPDEGMRGTLFHPSGKTLVARVNRSARIAVDISDEQLLKWFAEEPHPFQTMIEYQVEKLKERSLHASSGEVVRLDFESGRELDRHGIHLHHPIENSGYYGGDATLSSDGSRFAIAWHTSVEVWDFDGDAGD